MALPQINPSPAITKFNIKKLNFDYRLGFDRLFTEVTIDLPWNLFIGQTPK